MERRRTDELFRRACHGCCSSDATRAAERRDDFELDEAREVRDFSDKRERTRYPQASGAEDVSSNAATPAEPETEHVEAVISQLEREWVAAIVKKDAATIDRLLAEDFTGTSPTAHTYTKNMAIEDLKNGALVVASMELDEVSVNA